MTVGIPLYIVNLVREFHHIIENAIDKVLDLRICHVQKVLVAHRSSSVDIVLDNPVRMLLIKLAFRIDHLRLNPDAELEAFLVRMGCDKVNAFRQFGNIDLPIAQAGLVIVAWIFVGKPAIIEDKHLKPHVGRIIDHVGQCLGIEIEIRAFPAVQKSRHHSIPTVHPIIAGPPVEISAGLARSPVTESPDHLRSRERLALGQCIC